jgi:hypothetical protein
MKNKLKRKFLETYKWWDHSYLFMAIRDWLYHAHDNTIKHGAHVNSHKHTRKMKTIALAIDKYLDDDIQTNYAFDCRNITLGSGKSEQWKHANKRRVALKQFIFDMLNKHVESFWD